MNTISMRARLLASTVLLGAAAMASPVLAQNSGAAAAAAPGQEVVVTGSRIARKDYVADSPIVTVGQKSLEVAGSVTVETLLNELPQVVPQATSTSNNPSAQGRANVQLRGLGVNRTLVLVDGRRTTPSDQNGVVDVNTIPAALIDNIEVITGGASAAYGSDAVAGVINFKLKHHFTGVQVDAQYGQTSQGDGINEDYSITAGGDFADNKGNAVLSLTYATRGRIFNASRAFSAFSGGSSTIPQGSIASGGFKQSVLDAVFAKYGLAAGTVGAGFIAFNSDGTLFGTKNPAGGNFTSNYRGPTSIDFSTLVTGTTAVAQGLYNTGPLNDLVIPLERYTTYARTEYEVNRFARVYAQLMFTSYDSSTELAPAPGTGSPLLSKVIINGQTINVAGGTGFFVPVTNPFIPADLSTLLASRAAPASEFLISKRFSDVGPRHEDDRYDVYNLVTGVAGDFGFKDWTYDAFMSYGHDEQVATQTGNVSHQAVRQLLEAPDGGKSLCTGGYNPFGLTAPSAACLSYISRITKNLTNIDDRNVEVTLQGSLFALPADEVKFAVGADYRRQSLSFVPDSVLSTNDVGTDPAGQIIDAPGVVGFNAANPLHGSTDVYEVFGELFVPILRDLPFVKTLNANLGYRYSDYNTAGPVNSYKVDAEWKPESWILVRGGFQHAVRAPSIGELFAPQNNNFPSIGATPPTATNTNGDPCDIRSGWRAGTAFNPALVRALCLAQGVPGGVIDTFTYGNTQVQTLTGGNPALKAETANTYSVGVVFTPHLEMPLFSHISLSVDYYNIQIKHVIGTVNTVTAIDKCFNLLAANPTYSPTNVYCSFFVRDPSTGFVLTGNGTNSNLGVLKTAGEDIQLDWTFGLGALGFDDHMGRFAVNSVVTHLDADQRNDVPGSPLSDFAGSVGGLTNNSGAGGAFPEWKALTTVTFTHGPVDLSFRWQYLDSMKDASLVGAPAGTVAISPPAINYFDLFGAFRVNDTWEVRAGVNNIANKQPPFFNSAAQANTDPSTYDVFGRRWFLALKARF